MDEETEEYENHEDGKSTISADLIRGHINTIILRSLYDRDKYGYEIINEINEKSHGQYTLKQPTLYSALKRLDSQGYIQAYWKTDEVSSGGRRKYFRLTESGKEVTEKNQAEWEYSRTVIDNLISDKNFDFSQPAPTPVDFRILKQTTSRLYTGGGEKEEDGDGNNDNQPNETATGEPVIEALSFTSTHETSVVLEPDEVPMVPPEGYIPDTEAKKLDGTANQNAADMQTVVGEAFADGTPLQTESDQDNVQESVDTPAIPAEPTETAQPEETAVNEEPAPAYNGPSALEIAAAEYQLKLERQQAEEKQRFEEEQLRLREEQEAEQRRITHENYVKLISGDIEQPSNTENGGINTDDLIYANRSEAERDYRNLVDKLFEQTMQSAAPPQTYYGQQQYGQQTAYGEQDNIPQEQQQQQSIPQPQPAAEQPSDMLYDNPSATSIYSDINRKAANDGIKIQTSEGHSYSPEAKNTTYNRGATLFKCSLIVGVIMLFEFTMCLLFKDRIEISLIYPFIILTIGLAQILVCGILYGAEYGKHVRKPTNLRYIITSLVTTSILILIIVLFAIVLNVNWSALPNVLAKVIIPCIVALNIPIFTLSFYLFTKG